jgi:N-acetylmuramoyl-L-alanine amidase
VLHSRKGLVALSATTLCLLVFLLAGCATDARRKGERAPDWESEATVTNQPPPAVTPVVEAPRPAPPPPAPAPTNEVAETWVSLHRWCNSAGLAAPCPTGLVPSPAYTLVSTNGVFALRIGTQFAHWDGVEFWLGFAPQMIDGQPFVHALDLKKTLQPLICGSPVGFLRTNPTIVIDPGHGGDDAGAKSVLGDRHEREFTLDWARRLAGLLATNGWQVFLTRSNDTHLSLSNRVALAEQNKAGLFLSLHFNSAAPNEREAGLETYCLTPTGLASSVTRGYEDDPALVFPNNAFDEQNVLVAACVHRALLQVNGRHDRGVRRARYLGVLRGQNRPAILIEGGYLSNPLEATRIADPAHRQRMAEAVANALIAKFEARSPKPEVGSAEPVANWKGSESGSQRSEARGQKPEVGSQRSEVTPTSIPQR